TSQVIFKTWILPSLRWHNVGTNGRTRSITTFVLSGISDQKQKRAILLHLAGAEVQEIFETLPDTGEDYKQRWRN
ncbi:Hypothetical predicted protein, partial [Paramuricea clavata]